MHNMQKYAKICKIERPDPQNMQNKMQKICQKYAVYVGSIYCIYIQNMQRDFADDRD